MPKIQELSGKIVPFVSTQAYRQHMTELVEYVDRRMELQNQEHNLIGENPLSMMFDNHKNHGVFMVNVFGLNDYELLRHTLPWVFSSYEAKGFKSEYFDRVLKTWMEAIDLYLLPEECKPLIQVYEWMLKVKPEIEATMNEEIGMKDYPFDKNWENIKDVFFNKLLEGNVYNALSYAESVIHDDQSLKTFYQAVITYSLYQVGILWQQGDLSIAKEHLITAMVIRIMSTLYMKYIIINQTKGVAIVTAASNEYHEVGARMFSDLIELEGWDCHYLGANMPMEEVVEMVVTLKAFVVAISVTMSYNIERTIALIQKLQEDERCKKCHILVGGLAFSYSQNMEQLNGVPILHQIDEAIEQMNCWWEARVDD